MSPVDLVIFVIIAISTLMGVFRGFIREVLSLASWIIAVYLAWVFAVRGAMYLEAHISQAPLRIASSFAIIFVVVLILASILSFLLYRLFAATGISGMDRSLGAVFGFSRGVILVGALIVAAVYMNFAAQPWWHDARLVGYFTPVTELILSLMPPEAVNNFRPPATDLLPIEPNLGKI